MRRFTGDKFSAKRGYDLRKPLSKARARTINKYFTMIEELTSRPHKIIVPPKGTRKEIFEFTGQKSHPRFSRAIVTIPDPNVSYTWEIDKSQPKGSQFVLINKATKERLWHIPAEMFDAKYEENFGENIWDEEELSPQFFADVLEEYAAQDQVYMIEAGEFHMWGTAGHIGRVSEKMAELFKQYSHDRFDRYDSNSNWIGNWFRGVQVYGMASAGSYIDDRLNHEVKRLQERYGDRASDMMFRKTRVLKDGSVAEFYQGKVVGTPIPRAKIPGYDPRNKLHQPKKPHKRPKNAKGRNR